MIARKENKEYTVDVNTKDVYLNDGYDIYDDKGKLIEYSPKKQVSITEYIKLEDKVKELTLELEKIQNNDSNNKELIENNKALEKQVKELTKAKEKLEDKVKELTKDGDSNADIQK